MDAAAARAPCPRGGGDGDCRATARLPAFRSKAHSRERGTIAACMCWPGVVQAILMIHFWIP